uniref:Uncharacterized protein n=1 Tax=Hanusia phi TaxID=3032 RepID=A0A7S0E0Q1_9CRYP
MRLQNKGAEQTDTEVEEIEEECEPTAFNGAENEDIGEGGGEPYRGKDGEMYYRKNGRAYRQDNHKRVGFLATKVRFKMRCYGEGAGGLMTQAECDMPKDLLVQDGQQPVDLDEEARLEAELDYAAQAELDTVEQENQENKLAEELENALLEDEENGPEAQGEAANSTMPTDPQEYESPEPQILPPEDMSGHDGDPEILMPGDDTQTESQAEAYDQGDEAQVTFVSADDMGDGATPDIHADVDNMSMEEETAGQDTHSLSQEVSDEARGYSQDPMAENQQADEDQDLLDNLDAMVEEEAVDHAEEVQQEEEIAQQEQEEGGEMEAQGEEMDQIEQQEEIQAAAEDAAQEPREMTEEEKMILEEINTVKAKIQELEEEYRKKKEDQDRAANPVLKQRFAAALNANMNQREQLQQQVQALEEKLNSGA